MIKEKNEIKKLYADNEKVTDCPYCHKDFRNNQIGLNMHIQKHIRKTKK